jgi:hypothetical protein
MRKQVDARGQRSVVGNAQVRATEITGAKPKCLPANMLNNIKDTALPDPTCVDKPVRVKYCSGFGLKFAKTATLPRRQRGPGRNEMDRDEQKYARFECSY